MPSGDPFRGQPLLQPYAPRAAHAAAGPTRHTAPLFFSVPYRAAALSASSVWCWRGRGTYTTHTLYSLSDLQGGKIRGPVSALWGDVSGTLFPAGQIRIGSPMTAAGGLSCSVGHAALHLNHAINTLGACPSLPLLLFFYLYFAAAHACVRTRMGKCGLSW